MLNQNNYPELIEKLNNIEYFNDVEDVIKTFDDPVLSQIASQIVSAMGDLQIAINNYKGHLLENKKIEPSDDDLIIKIWEHLKDDRYFVEL